MLTLPPQCLKHIETANQLIVDESAAALKRALTLADGNLCDLSKDGKRIYYKAPDIVSLEYIINRALGTPGAKPIPADPRSGNDIEDALADIAHELKYLDPNVDPLDPEGPLRVIIGAVAKRRKAYRESQALLEQRVIEFLPTAIERMTELCTGVTVRREANGKTRTYTLRPNRRAIEHISRRIQGTSTPIVNSLDEVPAPDLTIDYTTEDIQKMTTSQIIALVTAAEAQEKQEKKAAAQLPLLTRNEWSGEGRGEVGLGTGYKSAIPKAIENETLRDGCIELPAYYTAACVQMAEYLPTAISHMKTLAQGAATIIETETGDRLVIDHAPDARANQFLIDLFIGAPNSRFVINNEEPIDLTPNAEPIATYTETIVKLCTSHPSHANQEDHIRALLKQLAENALA